MRNRALVHGGHVVRTAALYGQFFSEGSAMNKRGKDRLKGSSSIAVRGSGTEAYHRRETGVGAKQIS
jgi:hypothetical protein